MNLAHVHLLLNHFPTIGFGIGLALYIVSILGNKDDLKRASLVIFFLIAAVAIPTYMSGNAAEEVLKDRGYTTFSLVRAHEDAALVAFIFMEITGFIAWLGLWQFRLLRRVPRWNTVVVLSLSLISFALMARAANLGGSINHPEIQGTNEVAADESAGFARNFGMFVVGKTWVWPSCETLHFVGLSILFTSVFLIDLRMLGMAKKLSFAALYQLMPLGMLGFALNLTTGMFFFIGAPQQYTRNPIFYWKMVFVILCALNVLYFMLVDQPWTVGPGDDAPFGAKVMAASAIFLWIGVLFFGHMLPFLGNAF
ncbi:MAG TPA: hypothetical protein VGK48_16480 [Terriglobia bacterium]|jgi:uncharacterized membrane protein